MFQETTHKTQDGPRPMERKSRWHLKWSFSPELHEAIKSFLGFGRDVPPEILDDELIELIVMSKEKFETWHEVGQYVKSIATRSERAMARAVLMNLSRMRRENGGKLIWEV